MDLLSPSENAAVLIQSDNFLSKKALNYVNNNACTLYDFKILSHLASNYCLLCELLTDYIFLTQREAQIQNSLYYISVYNM